MKKTTLKPDCLPALIGSLPVADHQEAADLIFKYTPEIPLWAQLPVYAEEKMIPQFLPGLPGVVVDNDRSYVDTGSDGFPDQLLQFYEEYMDVAEGRLDLDQSRFALNQETARGFFVFLEQLKACASPPVGLKGQVTGPITFGLGVADHSRRAIFYDEQVRDAAVKLLALKAKFQVRKLAATGVPVLLFIDEPALTGFGSSAFISISREDIQACLNEIIEAIHSEGGMAGIHICGNADWSLILDSTADLLSFDAYAYFDKLLLYADQIKKFLEAGGLIAWGLVPTLNADDIEKESVDLLAERWATYVQQLTDAGLDAQQVHAQALITPACGTGSCSREHALRVLELTREVAHKIRNLK